MCSVLGCKHSSSVCTSAYPWTVLTGGEQTVGWRRKEMKSVTNDKLNQSQEPSKEPFVGGGAHLVFERSRCVFDLGCISAAH